MAVKPELGKDESLPFMVLGAASAAISSPMQPNIFHPVATTTTVADEMVDFALTKPGAKRIAIISHSDEWGKAHLEAANAELKKKGLEPVETVYLERGSTDATSQSLKIRNAKPDAVLAILYPPELAIYLRDAYKYAIKVPTLGTQGVSIEDTEKRTGIPAAVKDLYVFFPLSQPIDSPKFQKWSEIFKKYNPNDSLDTISFISMSGSLAVAEALKRLGPDVTREGFVAQLNKLRDFDPGIQSAPMTFTAEDHAGIKLGKMIHLVNGKSEIVASYPGAK
jgi:branched-chain amino acid transport system substrate-binding protein